MKTQSLATVLALVASTSATYDWSKASSFVCPATSTDKCTSDQSSGFKWGGLGTGSFGSYGGLDFSGFACASTFGSHSRRDHMVKRTKGFQDKCITGHASHDVATAPKFSCGSSVDAFSVDEFQVSVEFDCDLDFHYGMPDGSTCKQTSSCSKSGTTVKNTQCGGATSCAIVYPGGSKPNAPKPSCSIGVHSVGFHCGTPSATIKTPATSTPKSTVQSSATLATITSVPVFFNTSATYPHESPSTAVETPSSVIETSTAVGSTTAIETPSSVSESSTAVESTTAIESSVVDVPSTTPEASIPSTTPVPESTVITTVEVETTTTVCPVTLTHTTAGTTSLETAITTSTLLVTKTHTKTCDEAKCHVASPTAGPSITPASSPVGVITTPASSAVESSISPPESTVITTVEVETTTTVCPVTLTHTTAGTTSLETAITTSTILVSKTHTKTCNEAKCHVASPTVGPSNTPASSPVGVITTPVSSVVVASSSPASSAVESTIITTVEIETTTTICPVTLTHTTAGTTSLETAITTSTILISKTHTKTCNEAKCHVATATPAVSPSAPVITPSAVVSSPAPAETAPCPEILPQCLNTFMFSSSCSSNTDSDCYCTDAKFVCSVFDCLNAHGATDQDIDDAQKYFQGICANHVPVNPSLVVCASSVAPPPAVATTVAVAASSGFTAPVSSDSPAVVTYAVPVTTIEVYTTLTVPAMVSGTPIPSSSTLSVLSTVITVPQVAFTTETASGATSAALVVGTPAPASIPAGAITSNYVPVATPAPAPIPTTIAVSNGTIATPTPSPSTILASSSSHISMTVGSLLAAAVFAVFAI